ncbi:MAG: S9 family peptidase [Idiomarina sp.]|nr:S9 family peptidase [Idiomarina sp.]
MKKTLVLAVSAAIFSVSCASGYDTSATPRTAEPYQATAPTVINGDRAITLQQVMADPDWFARSPERPFWSLDGQSILFDRKREGAQIRDTKRIQVGQAGNGEVVALSELHAYATRGALHSTDRQLSAYTFERNIFVHNNATGELYQLTRDTSNKTDLQFLTDGRLSFRQGNDFYAIHVGSGRTEMLATLSTSDAPVPVSNPRDYLAREEVELIEYNQVQRRQRQERFDHQSELRRSNPTTSPEPFYLGRNLNVVDASLSPAGDRLIVAVSEPTSWRGESDSMPRYVTESGRIEMQDVRRRVADAQPEQHRIFLLDLRNGEKQELSFESLPGYDEDVLRAVREENYAARGERYRSERNPRPIMLMPRWSAAQGNVTWREDGSDVAIMLRAWDNKDRWIATVDLNAGRLVSQHRLHDEAWINRTFNDFGWLPGQRALWYVSEESNYPHIYVRDLARGGNTRQLTSGAFKIDDVTLDQAGEYFYFQSNKPHPGVFEIYRVSSRGGDMEQLTDLGGINSYVLSPDESQLLITHSSALQPPELYLQANRSNAQANRLTHTTTEAFAEMPWVMPDIVAIPSSHDELPIYSRVYLPADFDPNKEGGYPAVVFIHGAGYLQNAHAGWSQYFREFMFHNKLLQQGYVVLDLDFRGSKGYGRDWRTAVYRQMGTPEVEDLVDVVQWMGQHTNVDVERVGTYGGSYGGFLTFMALFKEPGLFKAGAALRPVTDWAHYNTGYTSNILNLPSDDPIAYRRSSPIYFAEGLEDALLISAPMVDDNVFFQDSVRLVQRLIELEKENFETAIFPVEPHGFVQPSGWLDQYRRIYKLFEDNLK